MKKLVFLFSVCTTFSAYSQDFNTVYYNANWEMTSMKFGKYYRNSGFNPETLAFDSIVVDHYMDGSIEMTGRYANGLKEGEFIYYYPDHSVRLITNYDKNDRSGLWTSFFENGQVNKAVEYKDNKERLIKYYNNRGNSIIKNLKGKYSEVFYYNSGFNSFSLSRTGENNWITNEIPEVMLKIKIDDEGKVQVNSVNPKVSTSFEKEVYRVINKISEVKIHSGNDYSLIYRIQCLDELDFKK